MTWIMISLFTTLTPLSFFVFYFWVMSKTASDNLNDAFQFMREYDREAAEMCNR